MNVQIKTDCPLTQRKTLDAVTVFLLDSSTAKDSSIGGTVCSTKSHF